MNPICWSAIENDIKAHAEAVVFALNDNCPDLLNDRYRSLEEFDVTSIVAHSSARCLFDQTEAGTLTDESVYSRDELADLDRLYHLVHLNDEIERTWRDFFGEGESALLQFIERVGTLASENAVDWISLDAAAEAAGIKRETLRTMIYSGKHPELELIRNADQITATPQIRLNYARFQTWLRNRRNANLAMLDNETNVTLLDAPLIRSHSRPTGKLIRALLMNRYGFEWHPQARSDNKKLYVFRHPESGAVIAVEHNLNKPKLWLEASRIGELPPELVFIKHRRYPGNPKAANPGETYGRHSGIKKYDELRTADLIAMTPATMGEVDRVVAVVVQP